MLYLYAFPVSSGSGRKVICLAFTLFYIFPSVFWASTQPLVLPTPIRLPFTPGLSRTARWSHNLLLVYKSPQHPWLSMEELSSQPAYYEKQSKIKTMD